MTSKFVALLVLPTLLVGCGPTSLQEDSPSVVLRHPISEVPVKFSEAERMSVRLEQNPTNAQYFITILAGLPATSPLKSRDLAVEAKDKAGTAIKALELPQRQPDDDLPYSADEIDKGEYHYLIHFALDTPPGVVPVTAVVLLRGEKRTAKFNEYVHTISKAKVIFSGHATIDLKLDYDNSLQKYVIVLSANLPGDKDLRYADIAVEAKDKRGRTIKALPPPRSRPENGLPSVGWMGRRGPSFSPFYLDAPSDFVPVEASVTLRGMTHALQFSPYLISYTNFPSADGSRVSHR